MFLTVAVFADESPIVAGNYTLDVSGADSIQIYYEPDVKFEAGLYKGDTKMEEGTIEGGAYTVKVGFVDQLSGKYIKSSRLLGEPKYTVSINGETQELTGKDGASQSIDVEVDGESLELTADVNYLKDYTDSASYTFKVCTLDMNVDAFKSANLKTLEGGANQITVEATRNGQPLTKEQWDAATLDVVSVNKDGEEFGIQWDVQKGSEVSTWIVTPKYKKGGMFATETGQADVTINVSAEIDGDGYGKAETVSVNIKDDKNIVDYLKRYWKHIVICRVSQMVTEEQRKRIGFAVFDTDINELREIREANPFIKTIQTSTKLTVGEYLNIDTHARDEWFPVNGILNSKSLTEGAGQVRAISRLALDTAIRAGNMEPLHNAIEELYKLEGDSSEQALRVVIVSSLAGGTGSGLILPVALYLKNYLATKFQASANITRGFFILPEVFYEVIRGQSERNNLKCNAYATLRELDAFLMKGDETLPEKYEKTVKLEFPRVGSNDVEEYNVRPYDFCFLFDAQNTEGKKLNSFNQYLDHAANCIYSQSIGPMNKRSNSSEDNTIRELCAERGRNRYAGAGSAMLIYPYEDVREYIALNWTKECVSSQWLVFDRMYKEKCLANAEMRAQGLNRRDINASVDYIESINQMAKQKDPFALSIEKACTIYDEGGYKKVNDKWTEYVGQLKKFVKDSTMNGQMDLDAQKNLAMGMINEVEIGSKQAAEELQDAYREMEKYKDIVCI